MESDPESLERCFSNREPLEGLHAFRNAMEALLVHRIDRHVRTAEQTGTIERADLDDHRRKSLWTSYYVSAAIGAEFARDRILQIATGEFLRRTLGVGKPRYRHRDENVGRAAGDVLAFAAMALSLHHRLAVGH